MPPNAMNTRMIKETLRYKLELGHSHERTARALHISKGVVAKYVTLAKTAELDWSQIAAMTEAELQARLMPPRGTADGADTGDGWDPGKHATGAFVRPDHAQIHRELSRKGMTLMLLWHEYQADNPQARTYQYSQYCDRYRRWAKTLKRSMRQIHRAGEKLYVDFAGPTLGLTDGRRVHIFVAAVGASGYTYALATEAEQTAHWIEGMTGALHFIGGVVALIVPDNPRAVIAQISRYEPRATDSVLAGLCPSLRHLCPSCSPPHAPRQIQSRIERASGRALDHGQAAPCGLCQHCRGQPGYRPFAGGPQQPALSEVAG